MQAMTQRNAILVVTSDEYFKYFFVFNKSLQSKYPNYPSLVVLWQKLTDEKKDILKRIPRVQDWDLDAINFTGGPSMVGREEDDPKLYYARYLIFSGFLKDYDNILYLDTDTVILRPLDELFKRQHFTVFQEAYQGVHPIIRTNIKQNELDTLMKEDQLPALPDVAANLGIFMAPRSIRSPENFQNIINITNRYHDYLNFADQSAMNLWMLKYGIAKVVDYRYNFQPLLLDRHRAWDAFKDIHIFHQNGMVKTSFLELLMNMTLLCWKIPLFGRWIYYGFHRFFFTQNQVRFPKLNFLLTWLGKRFDHL